MNRLLRNPLEFVPQLEQVNKQLCLLGYPEFWINEPFPLNLKDYNFENTPRIPWYWTRFSFVLDQLYLVHRDTELIINVLDLSTDSPFAVVVERKHSV